MDCTANSSKGLKTTQRWQLASGEHYRCFQRCTSPTGVVASLGVHCNTSQVSPNLEQTVGSLSLQYSSDQAAPTPAQVAAGLGFHHNFSQAPPNTAQAATKGRSHCNSYQVACQLSSNGSQPWLALEPLPKDSSSDTTYRRPGWHKNPTKVTPAPWGQTPHKSSSTVVMASPHS